MIDPLELTRMLREIVCKEESGIVLRRYWRFRGGQWYGGIATADCVGCNLRCKFCGPVLYMTKKKLLGALETPKNVAKKLVSIALKHNYRYLRISGGEPTICPEHLFQLLDALREYPFIFILETNGILLGYDKSIVEQLSQYRNVHVRISIKGTNPLEFQELTMADKKFFEYQLRALKNLLDYELSFHPAVVASFTTPQNIEKLRRELANIDPSLAEHLEIEYIVLYPHVIESLIKHKLFPKRAYTMKWELIGEEDFKRRLLKEYGDNYS